MKKSKQKAPKALRRSKDSERGAKKAAEQAESSQSSTSEQTAGELAAFHTTLCAHFARFCTSYHFLYLSFWLCCGHEAFPAFATTGFDFKSFVGERDSQHDRPFLRPRGGQEFRGRMALFGRACVLGTVSAQCMRRVGRYTTLHASFGTMYA